MSLQGSPRRLPEEIWDLILTKCSQEDWLQLCLVDFAMLERTARHLYRCVSLPSPLHLERLFCSRVSLGGFASTSVIRH